MTTNPQQSWLVSGVRKFNAAITRKDSILTLLRRLEREPESTEIVFMTAGVAAAAVHTLCKTHQAGVTFQQAVAWLNDDPDFCFIHLNREFNAGGSRRQSLLHAVATALDVCVQRGYISAVRAAETAPAPTVEKPQVLKVEIVGLPERITTTDIKRDTAGNIVASAQIERDATDNAAA